MSSTSAQPSQAVLDSPGPGQADELDAANQSLADALRKSFGVLKLLMLVLVVLYFLSGWFSVRPHEVGLILRCGRIVGTADGAPTGRAVLGPGWHWSWPYPFERWITVSTSERELPVEFMFQLSEEEQTTGIKGYKHSNLSPLRDDYLITGDVNILHASLVVKYRITDAVAYVTNVHPMPDPQATIRSPPYKRRPEYTVLTNLVRDAVIETAARRAALDIRGHQQDQFLLEVAACLNGKLDALEAAGTPLGIYIDPAGGVIAPKTTTVEAIMPPRQTQEVFDKVFAAATEKSVTITKAASEARQLLLKTAGPGCTQIAEAIEEEYRLMLALSEAESAAKDTGETSEIQSLRAALDKQRARTEELLAEGSGEVRAIIKEAEIRRDQVIKEAQGDHEQFLSLQPEYLKNPEIFLSRLRDETYANALDDDDVAKLFVPREMYQVRLHIPRSGRSVLTSESDKEKDDKVGTQASGPISTKKRLEAMKK